MDIPGQGFHLVWDFTVKAPAFRGNISVFNVLKYLFHFNKQFSDNSALKRFSTGLSGKSIKLLSGVGVDGCQSPFWIGDLPSVTIDTNSLAATASLSIECCLAYGNASYDALCIRSKRRRFLRKQSRCTEECSYNNGITHIIDQMCILLKF